MESDHETDFLLGGSSSLANHGGYLSSYIIVPLLTSVISNV